MENLMYPVGRYQKPEAFTEELKNEWLNVLANLPSWLDASIENLDEAHLQVPYREGGWTIPQVIHHIADSHLNAYVRVKLALTEDNPTVKPYDEKAWAELPDINAVPVNVSVILIHALHRRLVALLENINTVDWQRTYYHPEHQRNFPIWEVVALYAWHSRHHAAHIINLRETQGWN